MRASLAALAVAAVLPLLVACASAPAPALAAHPACVGCALSNTLRLRARRGAPRRLTLAGRKHPTAASKSAPLTTKQHVDVACNGSVYLVDTTHKFAVPQLSFSGGWAWHASAGGKDKGKGKGKGKSKYRATAQSTVVIEQDGKPWDAFAAHPGSLFYSHIHINGCNGPLWMSKGQQQVAVVEPANEFWLQFSAGNPGTDVSTGTYTGELFPTYGQPSATLEGVPLFYNVHEVYVNSTGQFQPGIPGNVLACCPITLSATGKKKK